MAVDCGCVLTADEMAESIEVQGVRFRADEVNSVTIKRNGHTIIIANDNDTSPIKGFAIAE